MLLADAISTFLTFKRAKGLAPSTLDWYAGILGRFDQWADSPQLTQVNSLTVALWLAHERNRQSKYRRKLSQRTVEATYRALSGFFNWCESASVVGKPLSPLGHGHSKEIERPKVDDPDMDYVTFDEYSALTSAIDLATWIDYRDWCLIGLMFWCGLRSGELLAMKVGDLRLPKKEARIVLTKTGKPRPAFLLDDLVGGLWAYLNARPAWAGPELWLAYNKSRTGINGGLTKTGLRMMLMRRCKRAGTRWMNPHLFRHGFAMEFLNAEADMKAVSTMLGHTRVATTEGYYAKWLDGPLRRVHQRIAARIAGDT